MKDKKNNDLVNEPKLQETSTKENNTQEKENKEKKKHTGLKVTAAVATGLVATGLVASALLPNVTAYVIDELEDGIYDLTKLSFDINDNFDPGGEPLICYYGIVEVPSTNESTGVEGFK